MTIIGTKWVFRNKLDENGIVSRNKARLVAQGYNQQEGIDYDETYAPIARLESIRILLAYACALDFKLFQMDVKSAFLNDFINGERSGAQRMDMGLEFCSLYLLGYRSDHIEDRRQLFREMILSLRSTLFVTVVLGFMYWYGWEATHFPLRGELKVHIGMWGGVCRGGKDLVYNDIDYAATNKLYDRHVNIRIGYDTYHDGVRYKIAE
ncbi:copia protein [Tanacetum coccineum]|uniref:Copia protein n=1 Tax=Tanacetum coccineum TaxID=301880 RepID=A0ABQ5GFV4_9ASTR